MLSKILLPRHYKTLKPAYIWKYFGFFIQMQVQGQESLQKKYIFPAEPPCISHHREYSQGYSSPPGSTPRTIPLPHSTPKPPPLAWVQALSRRFDFLLFFSPCRRPPTPQSSLPSSSPTLVRKLLNRFHLPVHHWSSLSRYTVTYLSISLHKFHGSYEHECHGFKASRYCSFWWWW